MSVNTDPQHHKLECVRVDQVDGELEFEFVCPDCGFRETLSLFESFARGDIYVSHTDGVDGFSYLSINLMRTEQVLPQCFQDFLDNLKDKS
jgi:hypothetical protein